MASKKNVRRVGQNSQDVEKSFSILPESYSQEFIEDAADKRRKFFREMDISNLNQENIKRTIKEIEGWKNGAVLMKIDNFKQKLKKGAVVFSRPFYSSQQGHKMRVSVSFENHESQFCNIEFLPVEHDASPPPCFHFRTTFTILDQSDRSERTNMTVMREPNFQISAEHWMYDPRGFWVPDFDELEDEEYWNTYFKNDTMYVKVMVEPLQCLFGEYFSRNGNLLWTIHNYDRTKLEGEVGIITATYSDYFYTSERGYRMQAQLEWGEASVRFMLCFFVGEYDHELPPFYSHTCTLSIVNQEDESGKNDLFVGYKMFDAEEIGEERAMKKMSWISCYNLDVPYEVIEKCPFLVNDKMAFRVVVESLE